MAAKFLILIGSLIFLILGTIHLVYTFFTNNFLARKAETLEWMKKDFSILTRRTTIWNMWIGFNASHSLGAMFIGLVNILLVSQYFEVYQKSVALLLLNDITVLFYLYVGQQYWFRIPLTGICISAICFISATVILLVQ